MRRICVFCGSSEGTNAAYREAAEQLGRLLVDEQIGLVYGGASVGLMGVLADAVLAGGGSVTGVIPRALVAREIAHASLSDLRVVDSMHERKALMAELADGFIALPGGMGTLEETCEILTWGQLGLHSKPCGLLNVCDYYHHVEAFLDHALAEGFLRREHRAMVLVEWDAKRLLDRLRSYRPATVAKWIRPAEA